MRYFGLLLFEWSSDMFSIHMRDELNVLSRKLVSHYTLTDLNFQFQYKHAVYVQTCKLFADLERMRQEQETREQHEK